MARSKEESKLSLEELNEKEILDLLDDISEELKVVRNSNLKEDVLASVNAIEDTLKELVKLRVFPPLLVEVAQ